MNRKISVADELRMQQALKDAIMHWAGQLGQSIFDERLDRHAILREDDYDDLETVEYKLRLAVPVTRRQGESGVILAAEIAGTTGAPKIHAPVVGCCGGDATPRCHVGFPCPYCKKTVVLPKWREPTLEERQIQFKPRMAG